MRDLLVVVAVLAVIAAAAVVMLMRMRPGERKISCATNVRGIEQSFIMWASNGTGVYPLPSKFDTLNTTVADLAEAKNTSANVYSILVFNGLLAVESLVCPQESNSQIGLDARYQYANPSSAASPSSALWDPALAADFTKGRSNTSYAHLQPAGKRLKGWTDTYGTIDATVGDRGPEVAGVDVSGDGKLPEQYSIRTKNAASIAAANHGKPGAWEGNIGYNDNHVEFQQSPAPLRSKKDGWATYQWLSSGERLDTYFLDEPDDAEGAANLFLGIFTTAGSEAKDFKAIWD